MKVLLAGATGAIGTPLTRALIAAGHQVTGVTRTRAGADRLTGLGGGALIADVLDRHALLDAVDGLRADAVVNELTALGKLPMRHRDMEPTNRLRVDGTANLVETARAVGARSMVSQSMILGYGFGDWGDEVVTEEREFAPPGHGAFERHIAAMRALERQTFAAEGLEGIVLRYGVFYGPGAGTEQMVALLRKRSMPIPMTGVMSMVHVHDAASATVAALERGRAGEAYNIADDEPVRWYDFACALADAYAVPKPLGVPGWLLRAMPYLHAMMAGRRRMSNAKAKRELGWAPAYPTYRDGIAATAAGGESKDERRGGAPATA